MKVDWPKIRISQDRFLDEVKSHQTIMNELRHRRNVGEQVRLVGGKIIPINMNNITSYKQSITPLSASQSCSPLRIAMPAENSNISSPVNGNSLLERNFADTLKNQKKLMNLMPNPVNPRNDSLVVETNLKCIYFYERSIVNKLDDLQLYIDKKKADIIGITETWLKEEISDVELNIIDYTIFRHDRLNKTGGGVILLIKKDIKVNIRDDLLQECEECVWCDVIAKSGKILFGICYRSSNKQNENDKKLRSLLNKVSKENVILMGDFNFGNCIDWESNTSANQGKFFLDCVNKNFLH